MKSLPTRTHTSISTQVIVTEVSYARICRKRQKQIGWLAAGNRRKNRRVNASYGDVQDVCGAARGDEKCRKEAVG